MKKDVSQYLYRYNSGLIFRVKTAPIHITTDID